VQGIGLICILSADHSNPLHIQLPSRYRPHKASLLIAILVPKLVAMATSLSTAGPPSRPNTRFLGPIPAHNPNGISIGSAVFAQMTAEWPYTLQCGAPFPSKLSIPMGGIWTPSNTWFLGPIRVPNPNGISIGAAVFAGLTSVTDRQTDRQTDRPTDHATRSVTIDRIYVLRCGLIIANRAVKPLTS